MRINRLKRVLIRPPPHFKMQMHTASRQNPGRSHAAQNLTARHALALPEFELLHLLLVNAGRVLPRETLIDRVWGSDYVGDTKTLDVHVKRLRSKIEDDPASPNRIVTIRGLGYKYERT